MKNLKIEQAITAPNEKDKNDNCVTYVEEFEEKKENLAVVNKMSAKEEEIWKYLRNIEDILKEAKEENELERDLEEEELKFKFAALVMNRFFFFGAILYFIVAFCSAVLSIPNFYKFQ